MVSPDPRRYRRWRANLLSRKCIALADTDIILNVWYSSLYRRALKLSLDWSVHRELWRGQALYIRSLFEANKDVRDPRQQKVRQDAT